MPLRQKAGINTIELQAENTEGVMAIGKRLREFLTIIKVWHKIFNCKSAECLTNIAREEYVGISFCYMFPVEATQA